MFCVESSYIDWLMPPLVMLALPSVTAAVELEFVRIAYSANLLYRSFPYMTYPLSINPVTILADFCSLVIA